MGRPKSKKSKTKQWCAVPGCTSDTRKDLNKHPWMQNITFEPFPTKKTQPRLRSKWLTLIRRPSDYDPKPWHRICSRHFLGGMRTEENNIPELFPWNNYKQPQNTRSDVSIKKRSSAVSQTHETDTNVDDENLENGFTCNPKKRQHLSSSQISSDDKCRTDLQSAMVIDASICPFPVHHEEMITSCTSTTDESSSHVEDHSYSINMSKGARQPLRELCTADMSVQTDLGIDDIRQLEEKVEKLRNTIEDKDTLLRDALVNKITKNDESISKYTGVPSLEIFNEIVSITDEYEPNLKYWLGNESVQEKHYQKSGKKPGPSRKLSRAHELIITLLRLRLALPLFLLSDLFGVSTSTVSSIFTTWMFYLFAIFKDTIVWPSRECIKKHMPPSFKKSFPRTRCIIDCTEIFIQRPRDPSNQAKTYSSYKSHNTYKFLIAITPTGAISFVSDIWGGNTSDRYITQNSGFLDMISPGDEIMADRGFTIRDLLTERHAHLTIPPFTRKCHWGKGKRLNASEIRKTRHIANLRIHVERAIQRMKKFKLLSQVIPWSMKSVVYHMIIVTSFLCNMMRPLVKK